MSDDNGRQLPAGWTRTALAEVVDILDSERAPVNSKERAKRVGDIPYYGATGQVGSIDGHLFDEDLVLLGEDGAPFFDPTKNIAYMIRGKSWVNNHAHVLRGRSGVLNQFLLHQLNQADYHGFVSGTTRPKLPQGPMRQMPFLLAPETEQQRIVDMIEELFSDLDAGVAALERVRRNLKRYRASVLKAAVEGTLTEAWRAEHPDVEPASELLNRILTERRRRWEADQLAAYKAKGKTPPKDWKEKYKEPTPLDDSALPSLPRSWVWASMDELLKLGNYGTSVKCTYKAEGVPVLRIPNIRRSEIDLADLKFATTEITGGFLEEGDILTCRTNGSIDLIGKAAVIRTSFSMPHHFASYLIRLRLVDTGLAGYVHRVFGSVHGRRFIEGHAASSAGQHNISLTNLRRFPIPLPPKTEVAVIEEAIDEAFSIAEAAVDSVSSTRKRADVLRQCILKIAFEGRLVPQNPNDEPASVLLGRIRDSSDASCVRTRRGAVLPRRKSRSHTRG